MNSFHQIKRTVVRVIAGLAVASASTLLSDGCTVTSNASDGPGGFRGGNWGQGLPANWYEDWNNPNLNSAIEPSSCQGW